MTSLVPHRVRNIERAASPVRMFDDDHLIALLNDRVLLELIRAEDDPARSKEIGELIVARARPLIDRVLEKHRHTVRGLRESDVDDIAATVALRLTRKLQQVPYSVDEAIREFDEYVVRTTLNVLQDLRRSRFPVRARLERRLRLILSKDFRLALWTSQTGMTGGLAEWQDAPATDARPKSLPRDAGEVSADAIVRVFTKVGGPLLFDALVEVVAEAWNIREEASVEAPPSVTSPAQESQTESRQLTEILWREILQLPDRQRLALLLNLRDAIGINALDLFPLTGVASFTDLARALGMPREELAAIWNELPLDDLKIGAIMNITRQQVINLRKSARQRLQRRLTRHHHTER